MPSFAPMYFQDLILTLQRYWNQQGCLLVQPYDVEKGAGTFSPSTFLRSLGPEPYWAAYPEPCRRPKDGRYGNNPIRMQHYYQFQVIMKPSPANILDLYFGSLKAIGISPEDHDLRLVHDDWESPTLGAWGLGWEVWLDGMEITQFTYFQQVGGIELNPVAGEITYGLERLCLYLQGVPSVWQMQYNQHFTYGDVFHRSEVLGSRHNFEQADTAFHFEQFGKFEGECQRLCALDNPVSGSDYCLKASHTFNLLDARGAISVSERQNYILRVRKLARAVAEAWVKDRAELGHPLLARQPVAATPPLLPAPAAGEAPVTLPESAPLLVELGVEEMPAAVFEPLLKQLPALFKKHFEPLQLGADEVQFYATPRRITLSVRSLRTRQADRVNELKGPPLRAARDANGQWTKAAEGFARKNGLTLNDLRVSGEYVVATVAQTGKPALELLASVIPAFFADIHWYKTMRWPGSELPFVRPVRWLVALLGEAVIPASVGGVAAGRQTLGHRFLGNFPITVSAERASYLQILRENYVLADLHERRETVRHQLTELAQENELVWVQDEALLQEVACLVEFPVPILCQFDARFLKLPEQVLITEMKAHQRYFAFRQRGGGLSHQFLAISNMICRSASVLQQGYQSVLLSRFEDARFFLEEDRKQSLAARQPALDRVVFQEGLGSLGDKVRRLSALAETLALTLGLSAEQRASIAQIAQLCKCDLLTQMVGEFPELQGEVGRYYALDEGLPALVADGIRDHYRPRTADDGYPASIEASIVGLADRLDTLTGIFALGRIPTSTADPFGLRRAVLASVALLVVKDLRLDLRAALAASLATYGERVPAARHEALLTQLLDFTQARVKALFRDESRPGVPGGFAFDTIDAVLQASAPWTRLSELVQRLQAMHAFRARPDFAAVAATFKRCNNILKDTRDTGPVNPALCHQPVEQALLAALNQAAEAVTDQLGEGDYLAALGQIAPLRGAVDAFFEAVMVNDPDAALRENRLRLVYHVVHLVRQLADFSAIQDA